MEKYFSSVICRRGYCSAYNTIYKKNMASKVFILSDGDDIERAVFFRKLSENFRGYSVSLFNPFYDDSPDGIFIENINTYILSDGGYNKISPVLAGEWEKYISIAKPKKYSADLRKEVVLLKSAENDYYKKACQSLNNAGGVRERVYEKISPYLDDDRMINFLRRFCSRTFKADMQKGGGTVRLLSSATPLGIHTHWGTMFDNCENIISIEDTNGFIGAVMLGVIKDYAISEKLEFIMSPTYSANEIPQFLLFPTSRIAVITDDGSHHAPFSVTHRISATRFLKSGANEEKIKAFLDIEKHLVDSAVLNLFEGREQRFKYNDLIKDYSDIETAKKSADELTERLMN